MCDGKELQCNVTTVCPGMVSAIAIWVSVMIISALGTQIPERDMVLPCTSPGMALFEQMIRPQGVAGSHQCHHAASAMSPLSKSTEEKYGGHINVTIVEINSRKIWKSHQCHHSRNQLKKNMEVTSVAGKSTMLPVSP